MGVESCDSSFARELLRQRDEARDELEKFRFALRGAQQGGEEARKAIQRIQRELDEARDAIQETPWHANGESRESWFERQREKYRHIECQRDEARKLARELLDALIAKGKIAGLTSHRHALIAKAKEVLG